MKSGYRTIPYEEGTERVILPNIPGGVKMIQNHSLWRGNWKMFSTTSTPSRFTSDTEPFPMKRELKGKSSWNVRKSSSEIQNHSLWRGNWKRSRRVIRLLPWSRYRTIPYEEGTESIDDFQRYHPRPRIQNHSLWRGNWKCSSYTVHLSSLNDTEPFPMKRELKVDEPPSKRIK